MINKLLSLPAKIFLGKGIDKRFPFLVGLYQKVSFLLAKEEIKKVKIPLNCKLYVSTKDLGVSLYLLTKSKFEPEQTKLFLKEIKKGNIVFDIGANIGYYTILASKLVGKKGRVYAFEPDERNLRLLQKNLKLNNCQNVEVIPQPVSNQTALVGFLENTSQGESKIKTSSLKGRKIKAISLDDFVKQKRIKKIDVLKMDIEGAEVLALKGGQNFLAKTPHLKIFLECNPESLKEFGFETKDLLASLGKLGIKPKLIINEFGKKTVTFTEKKLKEILKRTSFVSLYGER